MDATKEPNVKTEVDKIPEVVNTSIVVLDRGWVHVGTVSNEGENIRITNARNIRRWGTSKGLGELIDGPKPNTVLDFFGTVLAPKRSVISMILCNRNW